VLTEHKASADRVLRFGSTSTGMLVSKHPQVNKRKTGQS